MKVDRRTQLISVVIPCYNDERYLAAAIDSVLAQEHRPLEVLVVDDGSTDDSAAVARRYGSPIRVLSLQSNKGASAARNEGIKAATGHYLAFLDADDLWSEKKLECQLRAFDAAPDIDCLFGHVEQFHSPDLSLAERDRIHCPPGPRPGKLASAMLIRRETFMRVGLFDETLRVAEFVDWMARAEEANLQSVVLSEMLLRRRLHGSNAGITRRSARPDFARTLKAALDRRRKKAGSVRDEN